MSSIPPADARLKRPRWLLVAIVAALVFGAGCWTTGCSRLSFYRGERSHDAMLNGQIQDDVARAKVEAMYERFGTIADEQRNAAVPLAVATFVLGAALLTLSARGIAGRTNTRSALVQVMAAQAIVVALSFGATKRLREAELDWDIERTLARQHEMMPADKYEQAVLGADALRRFGPTSWIIFRTLASGLVIFALTRQRSREFFEAAANQVPEP